MKAAFIPKDMAGNCQPWQFHNLERTRTEAAPPPRPQSEIDADKLRAIAQQAYKEGYAAGRAAGDAQARAEAARLAALAEAFDRAVSEADQSVSEDVLRLALDLAQAVIRDTLDADPGRVVPMVREVMENTPPFSGHARLALHPADAELVRLALGDELAGARWFLSEDHQVEPGGCRVETTSCQIDATLGSRWDKVTRALGQEAPWQGPSVRRPVHARTPANEPFLNAAETGADEPALPGSATGAADHHDR